MPPDTPAPLLGHSEDVRTEYVVVRDDGVAVPMYGTGGPCQDLRLAVGTLENRQKFGKRHPYRIQRRTITTGPWEDFDA